MIMISMDKDAPSFGLDLIGPNGLGMSFASMCESFECEVVCT